MSTRVASHFLTALLACAVIGPISPAMAQIEQQQRVSFELPAGALGEALNQLSRQAGVTLSYQQRDVKGLSVQALSGSYSITQALQMLLRGSGLMAEPVGLGGWLIQASIASNITLLDSIQVQSRNSAVTDQVFQEPASVNIITREQIERFRGTSVGDIFQGTAGVLISENRNSGGLDVNIRGMQGQGRVPVVIDGSRQETTVYRGYSGVSSRSYIDPDLIGTIRIDKGPVMTAEGTGATGGVVSVSTLKAEDVVKPGKLSGLRLRATGIGNNSATPDAGTHAGYYLPLDAYRSDCNFDPSRCVGFTMPESFAPATGMERPDVLDLRSYALSLAGAKRFDWGDLVAAYAVRKQGNYYAGTHGPAPQLIIGEPEQRAWYKLTSVKLNEDRASRFRAGERIPNTNFTSESLLLKSNLVLPDDQALEFSYIRYDSQYGEMMPSQISFFGQARQWLDSEVLNQTYAARYKWQPVSSDWIDLKANLWHTDAVTDLNTPAVGSVDLASNIARSDDYQRWGLDISNRMLFFPYGQLQLDYGLALQREEMDTDTPQTEGSYAGSRKGSRNEISTFAALEWQPSPQWTFNTGIRYSRFHSQDDNPLPLRVIDPNCTPDGNGGCEDVYYKNDDSGVAPITSVTWEPLQGLQFYLRYAEALRMPSLFEGTSGLSVSPALNILLKPEHTTNKEIGINYLNHDAFDQGHQARFKLAYFRNHTKDYLTRTQPDADESLGPGDYFRLRNIQGLTLHGLELSLGYDADSWLIEFSGTRYDFIEICHVGSFVSSYCTDWGLKQSYANNMIPPNWHASLHLGGRLFGQKLEFGSRTTFMGKRNHVAERTVTGFIEPVLWHKYTTWDLYASYQFDETTSIDVSVDNITDRYYLDALSLGLVPAPGRTAKVGLTLQF